MAEKPLAPAEVSQSAGADEASTPLPPMADTDPAGAPERDEVDAVKVVDHEDAPEDVLPMPTSAAAREPGPLAEGAPAHAPADVWLDLDALDSSARFQLCPEGEVDALATSIVRDGQLFAIDVRPAAGERFEIICGFRRAAALRLLMRRRVLARVHQGLSDADALALALAALVETRRVDTQMLEAVRDRLDAEQRLTPMAAEILTRAITPEALELSPETVDGAAPAPLDPCALVQRLLDRLAELNQDLSQLAQCWEALPREVRDAVLQQLVYPSEMARYLKKQPGGLF